MEYLSKYLQRSFANSRISIIRWELLLSSESVQKMKWFSLIRSRFSKIASFTEKGKFSIHPVLFYPVPSSDILHSSYDDVYRHTHADYQQPTIAWIFLSILVPSRGETISCLNKEDGTNKADATPDKQICIQLWRNLSGVINFIPAGDKSIGIVGNLIYTSLPRRNDPLSVESKGDGNHLSPLSLHSDTLPRTYTHACVIITCTRLSLPLRSCYFFLLRRIVGDSRSALLFFSVK